MSAESPHYVCIDDEGGDRLEALLDRLRRNGVAVDLHAPAPFDEEVALIAASSADGLLLDLRLDDVPSSSGTRVRYRAVALAQELRTRMTEGGIAPRPIVLWSVERKFRQSFSSDSTGHDLFDLVISKTEVSAQPKPLASKFVALAKDYPHLRPSRSTSSGFWSRVLGFDGHAADLLDARIGAELRVGAPTHEYAGYIIRELLDRRGPLADESLVAARLGIATTSPDWDLAKTRLDYTKYRGTFAGGWARWWWPLIETMLRNFSPGEPFRTLTADERLAVLKAKWALRLEAPPVPDGSTGTRYWYVCAATGAPLDPIDAVAVESGDLKSWQDRVYVSIGAVLTRRAASKGFRIHPLEQARIDEIVRK